MPKTTYLGLELTDDENTKFGSWQQTINGMGVSNMKLIDDFVGAIYGVSGTAKLTVAGWTGAIQTLTFISLGNNDAIFLAPAALSDKTLLDNANVFVSASGNTVTFTATTVPTSDVNLNYFISRGKA